MELMVACVAPGRNVTAWVCGLYANNLPLAPPSTTRPSGMTAPAYRLVLVWLSISRQWVALVLDGAAKEFAFSAGGQHVMAEGRKAAQRLQYCIIMIGSTIAAEFCGRRVCLYGRAEHDEGDEPACVHWCLRMVFGYTL